MQRLLAALLLTMSVPAVADHCDVIEFKLKDGLSLATYLQVVKDFKEWGKGHGCRAEIAGKVQHPELTTPLARFAACSTHPKRSGMDTERRDSPPQGCRHSLHNATQQADLFV